MLDIQLPDHLVIANEVGSDVPFFINGKPAKVKNIGDKVEDYFIEKEIFFLIILPNYRFLIYLFLSLCYLGFL